MSQTLSKEFTVHGTTCRGTLYLPENRDKPPVVVMAHGFGARASFGLEPFAEKFNQKGLAAFVFDYRNFGLSDGTPRNLVNPWRHIRDWHAALAFVRSLDSIDHTTVALWGTSFSGGHVLAVAARDKKIAAVVSQVPFVDGPKTVMKLGPGLLLKSTGPILADALGSALAKKPYMVKIVARPDTFAALNTPDAWDGYVALVSEQERATWENACPARALLYVLLYRPGSYAGKVACPTLMVMAENDALIPAAAVESTARALPAGELVRLPVGHFDVYTGDLFKQVSGVEADFLARHLLGG